jgi:hypothetical protein
MWRRAPLLAFAVTASVVGVARLALGRDRFAVPLAATLGLLVALHRSWGADKKFSKGVPRNWPRRRHRAGHRRTAHVLMGPASWGGDRRSASARPGSAWWLAAFDRSTWRAA